jgi:hypothetical protein
LLDFQYSVPQAMGKYANQFRLIDFPNKGATAPASINTKSEM